jgi:hypothetical protein
MSDHLAALAENVAHLRSRAVNAERRLREWQNDSFPKSSGFDSAGRSTISGSPVEVAALAPNEIRDQMERLRHDVMQARRLTDEAVSIVSFALDPVPEMPRRSLVVSCHNCDEPALPRAKAGRCPACYEYRRRNKTERPKP